MNYNLTYSCEDAWKLASNIVYAVLHKSHFSATRDNDKKNTNKAHNKVVQASATEVKPVKGH